MESYLTTIEDQQDCLFGCPVNVKRILKSGWDQICQAGRLETSCTEPQQLIVEIQPFGIADGETLQCQVNGITVDAKYKFWYEPQNNFLFTAPKSEFISASFDAGVFYGGWTVVEHFGEEYVVMKLANETASCNGVCGDVVCQHGILVKFKDCFQHKDTEDKADDEFAIEDATQWEEITDGNL